MTTAGDYENTGARVIVSHGINSLGSVSHPSSDAHPIRRRWFEREWVWEKVE